ncbi:MAG TPA: CatB-related O-acetyltransferase [Chitinophagales bacterium]|nr:CatB-related O-acetyltransferase [Chitinophagales bacterium]
MINRLKESIRYRLRNILKFAFPELNTLENKQLSFHAIENTLANSSLGKNTWLYPVYKCTDSKIGDYTYVATNSKISFSEIGKFCSIGPNFICGWGIHPTNGVSTSPMFYSTGKQNGVSLTAINKIEERKKTIIGNDVFIGMNATILDGVTVGDGAVIGAGAVVSQDIPPYAVAVGVPARVAKYRFDEATISKLQQIKWWNFADDKLQLVEQYFFDINRFIEECKKLSEPDTH